MATQNNQGQILVRATVILRIPDVDSTELTALYTELNKIKEQFGGEYDVTTTVQQPEKG
jgi:hypothetical protein